MRNEAWLDGFIEKCAEAGVRYQDIPAVLEDYDKLHDPVFMAAFNEKMAQGLPGMPQAGIGVPGVPQVGGLQGLGGNRGLNIPASPAAQAAPAIAPKPPTAPRPPKPLTAPGQVTPAQQPPVNNNPVMSNGLPQFMQAVRR